MKAIKPVRNTKPDDGFTIVEIAIVLIIFGLVMTSAMLGLRVYTDNLLIDRTLEAMEETQRAVFVFQIDQGMYPCPADPQAAPGDANFGVADCDNANLLTVLGRDVDNADGDNDPTTGGEPVLIGAVPHITLLDPDDDPLTNDAPYEEFYASHAFDGWGNKLTYAVTQSLADDITNINPQAFDHENGAIYVVDENNTDILQQPGIAHLVLISHGENGQGAFTREGNYVGDCVDVVNPADVTAASTKIPKDDRENCDHEEAAVADAIFLKGIANDISADYNDDILKFTVSNVSNLWAYTSAIYNDNGTPGDPNDDFLINQIENTNGGNIGIGVDSPQASIHLEGDVQAFEIHSTALCDTSGNDCLPAEYIAGNVADMQCPTGQVVTQIGRTSSTNTTPEVVCTDPFDPSDYGPCPAGTYLTGISSASGVICATP